MFLKREKQILNLLFKNQQKFTTSQIAAQLKVSTRTIKADIKKINEELEKYACSIQTKQGVGLWLDYSGEGEKFLKSVLYEDQENVYLAQDTRKYRLAVELLLQKDYISMENIANKFYISKGTVVNDFNELEDFWKKFELTFIKKVKYGIRVEGEEGQIRLALTEA
jgi:lichenan operon transcriptional antiterminator